MMWGQPPAENNQLVPWRHIHDDGPVWRVHLDGVFTLNATGKEQIFRKGARPALRGFLDRHQEMKKLAGDLIGE
jgi:hypothetical protein